MTRYVWWALSIGARPAPRLHAQAIKVAVWIGVRPSPVHASPVGERRVAAAFIRITLQVGFTGTAADPHLATDRRLAPAEPSDHEGNEDEKEAVRPCEIPNHRRTPESAIRSVECLYWRSARGSLRRSRRDLDPGFGTGLNHRVVRLGARTVVPKHLLPR